MSFLLAGALLPASPAAATPAPSLLVSRGPTYLGCPVFPADNAYNTDIYNAPIDPHSSSYMQHMNPNGLKLHPDFGGYTAQYGQPFAVVTSAQPLVPMSFQYAADSDPGPYPYPLNLHVQGDGLYRGGDRHGIVFDEGNCKLYETWSTYRSGSGYHAGSGAIFDLRSNKLRPDGWTSANAAGLPIFAGLARYEEAGQDGAIRHALAFGAGTTAHAFVHPATHSSGTSSSPWAPPMGTRVRLKRSFDLSKYHGQSLVILRAMQHYGMFLIDNQNAPFWSIAGSQDARWNNSDLQQIKTVPASAFEVVQLPGFHAGR